MKFSGQKIEDELEDFIEEELCSKLEPIDRIRFDAFEWLANEQNRGQGRTHLLALVFLKLALMHPQQRIYFWDHIPEHSGQNSMRNMITNILNAYPGLSSRFKFANEYMIFQGIIPIIDKPHRIDKKLDRYFRELE